MKFILSMLSCIWWLKIRVYNTKYCNNPSEFRLTLLFAKQNERAQNIFLCVCIKHSAEEKPCYGEELEEDMRYTRRRRYEIYKTKTIRDIHDEDELRNNEESYYNYSPLHKVSLRLCLFATFQRQQTEYCVCIVLLGLLRFKWGYGLTE